MAINIGQDTLIPAKDAPALIQKWTGKKTRVSHSTLHRWFSTGVAGVVLDSCLIAGERFTSEEAMRAFFNESAKAKSKRHRKATAEGIRRRQAARDKQAAELGI